MLFVLDIGGCYHLVAMSGVLLPVDQIKPVCEQNLVQRLELFGSAATDRFDPRQSDFDFLVTFKPMRMDQRSDTFFGLLFALEDMLMRNVDLVDVEAIRNPYFMQSIQHSPRKLIYESGSTQTIA